MKAYHDLYNLANEDEVASKQGHTATVRPKEPTLSRFLLIGMTPVLEVKPTVGLIPTTPLILAGPMIEVSVSVPNARGTIFADTATADPELDPTTML